MKPYEERLEEYAKLKAEHPDEPLRFFADHFGVNVGTVSRWGKALKKLDIKGEALDELRTQIEKEMEAKYAGIAEDKEQARAAKEAAQQRASENRRQHFQRILNTCARETIVTSQDEDITWQGHQFHIKGGVPTEVPEVVAGVLRDAQKQRGQASRTIEYYKAGQHLGRV